MFDFGDDTIIDSYRIPWLIWIQILIMFLLTLTILLSYFGFSALESSSPTHDSLFTSSSRLGSPSFCSQTIQVAGNHDVRREMDTSTGNRTRSVMHNDERGGSSVKDLASAGNGGRFFHPCRYLDLAKQAFLKCLGLGSISPNSPDKEHEHED